MSDSAQSAPVVAAATAEPEVAPVTKPVKTVPEADDAQPKQTNGVAEKNGHHEEAKDVAANGKTDAEAANGNQDNGHSNGHSKEGTTEQESEKAVNGAAADAKEAEKKEENGEAVAEKKEDKESTPEAAPAADSTSDEPPVKSAKLDTPAAAEEEAKA